ncbi:MAG: RNA polymerase factor sigma-54 [bacterium]
MAGVTLSLVQQQRQIMTMVPQLRQSLELLQKPILELQQVLKAEMAINPVIEEIVYPNEVPMSTVLLEPEPKPVMDEGLDFNPDVDAILQQDDEWRDYFLQGMENASSNNEEEEKRQYFYDSIPQQVSLQEHLTKQLLLTSISEADAAIAQLMIGYINDDGYFEGSIPDLIMVTERNEHDLLKILKLIQTFDPVGIGARNLQECLLLQLNEVDDSPWEEEARLLIEKYLERLAAHDEKYLCKALSLEPHELKRLIAFIRTFNPRPGRDFETTSPQQYVVPEVFIVRKHGKYVVELDNKLLPHIRISKHYRDMLSNPAVSAKDKSYIRERIRSAAFFINSKQQRQETIRKISQVIVDTQTPFFDKGVSALRPLTMSDVAAKVGMHETTVSRTVSGKYIQTPRGVFELKYFFTTGLKTASGGTVSNRSIQDEIKQLVEAEDLAEPLSDQAIEAMLAEKGFKVARRTIAKYRGVLKIAPSHQRRRD